MRTWSSLTLAIGTVSTAVVVATATGCGDAPPGGPAVPTTSRGDADRQVEHVAQRQPATADIARPGPAGR